MDHIRFFVGDEAFCLTLIHEVMDLFSEVSTFIEMRFFL